MSKPVGGHARRNKLTAVQQSATQQLPPLAYATLNGIVQPFDRAAVGVALWIAYNLPAMAASIAVAAGAPMKVAHAIQAALPAGVVAELADVLAHQGVQPFASDPDARVIDPSAVAPINWTGLAAEAGEPVDMPAWQAWTERRFGTPA